MEREGAMTERQIVVETGLEERAGAVLVEGKVVPRTRHARTRFVEALPVAVETVPGDRWSPPLVAARLQRMAEIFWRDAGGVLPTDVMKTCMPDALLERGKDYAPVQTVPRERLTNAQIDFACTTFQVVLRLFVADERAGAVIWCIANRKSFAECAVELNRMLKRRDVTRFDVRNKWAEQLGPAIAELFNALRLPIDLDDVTRASRRSFHRKI